MSTLPSLSLKHLVELLNTAGCAARLEGDDAQVGGMTVDSREAAPGCLFVCKGASFKPAFLASAIDAGAAAYLCDETLAAARLASSHTTYAAPWRSWPPRPTAGPTNA